MRSIVYTATAADVAAGFTPPLVMDYNTVYANYGLQYQTSAQAPGTGTLQQTYDDPFNPPTGGLTWAPVGGVLAGRAVVNDPVRAFRVLTPVLADVVTIVPQGII